MDLRLGTPAPGPWLRCSALSGSGGAERLLWLGLAEEVGDEGAEVVGDGAEGFADSEAAAVLVDHPEAEDGVAMVEDGVRGEGLDDLRAVVRAGGGGDGGVVADEGDVGAFAGH